MITRFNVDIETSDGKPIMQYQGVPAQTKKEAINKVKQQLVFTAERVEANK